jgi:hypothetical protein
MMPSDLQRHVGKYYGKYAGTVTAIDDASQRGIITVTVPAVFGAELPVRARPCFSAGHFFVPPVGAQVWIEFEAGDPQYPIWVGTWHPEGQAPAEAQVDPPEHRVIHTPSGHRIELRDGDDEGAVIVRHRDDSFVSIDKDGSVVIANKNGSTIYLNAAGSEASITSEQGHTIAMNADAMVLMNKDGAALDLTGDTVRIRAPTILLDATTVALGNGAAAGGEPTVMGTAFQMLWTQFQLHTHPSAMGPTGTPVPPAPIVPATHLSGAVLVK